MQDYQNYYNFIELFDDKSPTATNDAKLSSKLLRLTRRINENRPNTLTYFSYYYANLALLDPRVSVSLKNNIKAWYDEQKLADITITKDLREYGSLESIYQKTVGIATYIADFLEHLTPEQQCQLAIIYTESHEFADIAQKTATFKRFAAFNIDQHPRFLQQFPELTQPKKTSVSKKVWQTLVSPFSIAAMIGLVIFSGPFALVGIGALVSALFIYHTIKQKSKTSQLFKPSQESKLSQQFKQEQTPSDIPAESVPKAITAEAMISESGSATQRRPHLSREYQRHPVLADGQGGLTVLGVTRSQAQQLINQHLSEVITLLKPAVKEALLSQAFVAYLQQRKLMPRAIEPEVIQNTYAQAVDERAIIRAYLDYAIRDSKLNDGWAHPAVLQALADIQNIAIRIWHLNPDQQLIPHEQLRYSHHQPALATHRLDLLGDAGNHHFERIELTPLTTATEPHAVHHSLHPSIRDIASSFEKQPATPSDANQPTREY